MNLKILARLALGFLISLTSALDAVAEDGPAGSEYCVGTPSMR